MGMNKISRWIKIVVITVGMVISSGIIAKAAIFNVPLDYSTIQSAIDAASSSDEVIVSASGGPYVENITFDGTKILTVKTIDGAVIDGDANGSVVKFTGGDTSTLDGFNITNGSGTDIGSGNTSGGGIYCASSSSSTIINCNINNNSASYGGGMYCESSSPTLTDCIISNNSSSAKGGGVCYRDSSSPMIINCDIRGNSSLNGAGIISWYTSSPYIINSIITGNKAEASGGGIQVENSSSLFMINSTVTGNDASLYVGGGVYCTQSSSTTITNSIFWGDTVGGSPNEIDTESGSSVYITYSDVQGGWGVPADNNINLDPMFVTPILSSSAPTTAGNLHLQSGSPCIDMGTSSGAPSDDIDGNSRPQDGNASGTAEYDMGADEYLSSVTLNPDNPNPQPGNTVCLPVEVTDFYNLYAASFDLVYSASVVTLNNATEGPFLDNGIPADAEMLANLLGGAEGQLVVGISRLGDIGGISGSGTLANICYDVVGGYCSSSNITFDNVCLERPDNGDCVEGDTIWSDTTIDVTLPAPVNPNATGTVCNQINLSWDAVADAGEYKVYRSNESGGIFEYQDTTIGTSYNDTDACIIPTLDYYYKVQSIVGACESEDSEEVSGTADGLLGDINRDGRVNGRDLSILARAYGSLCSDTRYDCQADLNRSCPTPSVAIDGEDLIDLSTNFGLTWACP
jgi:parallel beta-helix repeat protein